jgi:hypothetical protein
LVDFLHFVRSRDPVAIPHDRILSFISISGHLGNERLALVLLSSLKSDSSVPSQSQSLPSSTRAAVQPKTVFDSATVDRCASKFYSYSIDELRFLDRQTLHRLLSSECLAVENEDSLLRLLLDLEWNRREFLGYIEISFLSKEGLTLFVGEVSFEDLCEDIWLKVISCLRGDSSDDLRARRYRALPRRTDSIILPTLPLCLRDLPGKRWTLLYRGSRDGFGGSDFHQKCNGKSNTLTVIETTKGFVFGGFTPVAWDSSSGYKADSSQKSFLFTVKNPRGSDGRKFVMASSANAIRCYSSFGPTFGNNYDIYVANGCNENTSSYTNLGSAFTNDTGIDGSQVFTGEYNFTVKEIEVFLIDS